MLELVYRALDYFTGPEVEEELGDLDELRALLDGIGESVSVHIVHTENGEPVPFHNRDISDVDRLLDNQYGNGGDLDIEYREYTQAGEIYVDIEAPSAGRETSIGIRDF